ncbi:MAG: hypothetical protein ACREOR_04955, partial [Candidatus Binatia bacterium]
MFADTRAHSAPKAKREAGTKAARQAEIIGRIRAALEKERRINLHRFPITLAFDGENLVLTGDLEH